MTEKQGIAKGIERIVNDRCEGCSTYDFDGSTFRGRSIISCDYSGMNTDEFPCPCALCLIKSMCEEVCNDWRVWRSRGDDRIDNASKEGASNDSM